MNDELKKIVKRAMIAANLDKALLDESLEFHIFCQLFAHLLMEELEAS